MKVYSNTLTRQDLGRALPKGVFLWQCDEMPRTRIRARGWIVSLSGTSPYRSQTPDSHQAATYDEHGEWMAALFAIDPDARISWWKGAEEFAKGTENRYALTYGGAALHRNCDVNNDGESHGVHDVCRRFCAGSKLSRERTT